MASAHHFPILFSEAIWILAHDGAGLSGEVTGGAHQHHSFDTLGLLCGKVQQNVASAAHAESLESTDFQVIEQCQDVCGGVLMAEYFRRVVGSSVAAHIGHDELKTLAPVGDQWRPILAASTEAV